jgi:[ribosomal protein S18]-alanine N-acetyltransferase
VTDRSIALSAGSRDDLDEVMAVMEDSFDPVFGEAWTAPQCAGLMPMPGVWLTLAKDGERTVGFALSRIVANEAELLLLAVRNSDQKRGAGRLLLDGFVCGASERGAERLHLEVRDGNPAVRLYLSAGFTVVGRRKAYYNGRDGQLYDALTLARPASSDLF